MNKNLIYDIEYIYIYIEYSKSNSWSLKLNNLHTVTNI